MIGKVEGGATRYFLNDRLSARVVLDVAGNIVGRQGHLPFGEEIGTSGEQDKHHFTTYERNSETLLDYAVNRHYSSTTGRFLSKDPYEIGGCVASPQKWSRYAYGTNDCVNKTDPLGLDCTMDSFAIDHGDNYGNDILGDINGPGLNEIDSSILENLFGTGLCGVGTGGGGSANACDRCVRNVYRVCGNESEACHGRNERWYAQQQRRCAGRPDEKQCLEAAYGVYRSEFNHCGAVFQACLIVEKERRCRRVCGG